MSLAILGLTWEHGPRDMSLRGLLMAYAEHADAKTGECWPSDARLQEITNFSRRTLIRHRATLIELGYLELVERKRTYRGNYGVNLVRINFEKIGYTPSAKMTHGRPTKCQTDTWPSAKMTPGQTKCQNGTTKNTNKNKGANYGLSTKTPLGKNRALAPYRNLTTLAARELAATLTDFQKSQIKGGKSVLINGDLVLPVSPEHNALRKILTASG